jgi:hypothetical protein
LVMGVAGDEHQNARRRVAADQVKRQLYNNNTDGLNRIDLLSDPISD